MSFRSALTLTLLQRYFTSKGIHGTLEQLADLAPVTKVYRPLRKKFITFTGSSWQGTSHSKADTALYINKVSASQASQHFRSQGSI